MLRSADHRCRADSVPAGRIAPESTATIGQGVVIEGEVKGDEDLVVDGQVDGTIELPQHVVGSTGRAKAELSAKAVVVLGKVSGSIQGERAGAHRRDRLGRRSDLRSAAARGRRGAPAGPGGRVGRVTRAGQPSARPTERDFRLL